MSVLLHRSRARIPVLYDASGQTNRRGSRMTTETRLTIVEATPAHAPFIAWVTLTAFRSQLERGFWDFLLDGDEAYKLRYLEALATTEQFHWAHYSAFIVAEVDGRPVSALCGYF